MKAQFHFLPAHFSRAGAGGVVINGHGIKGTRLTFLQSKGEKSQPDDEAAARGHCPGASGSVRVAIRVSWRLDHADRLASDDPAAKCGRRRVIETEASILNGTVCHKPAKLNRVE